MQNPDYDAARSYILGRLERELSPLLTYHGLAHTREDVLPAAERLGKMEGLQDEELLLLRTAACYHDAGFIEQYSSNEEIARRIAAETLPGFGYSPGQVQVIGGIILATRMPQQPQTHVEQVMADADLDSLGREDYWTLRIALRREHELYLGPVSDAEWLRSQIAFIQNHCYFTRSAHELRDATKQGHIARLLSMLKG